MKKFLTILLALCMVATMSVTAFAAENDKKTDVTYDASENGGKASAEWTVTVPASLTTGGAEGEVKVEGYWAPSSLLTVSTDETVTMYLGGEATADYAVVPVDFAGISKEGSYTESVNETEMVSVDDDNAMGDIKFGVWKGTVVFNVALVDNPNYTGGNNIGGTTAPDEPEVQTNVVMNGTNYASLDEALAAAQGGETIVCAGDVSVSNAITKAVTIDGGSFASLLTVDGVAVTLKNATFTDTEPGEGAYTKNAGVPYRFELLNGASVTEENNATVLNVSTAADLWEITNVSNRITKEGTVDTANVPRYQFEGVTININSDIDLNNAEWRPICQYPDHPGFKGTINGNGNTIYNLNCYGMNGSNSVESDGLRHCQGFVGQATEGAVIKNLNFKNANIFTANSNAAVIVGQASGAVTVDNCHIDTATIEGNYYMAGIIGGADDRNIVSNCTVKNVTVKSWYQNTPENYSGAIFGSASKNVTVTNSTYENVVVQYVADNNGDDVKEVITSVEATH